MPTYQLKSGSSIRVKARSSIHDTVTVWNKITGSVVATVDTLATAGAVAAATVDMTAFDAGDFLKNRKLRKDFDIDEHPAANFALEKLTSVARDGNNFTAIAQGSITWRGRSVPVAIAGKGTMTEGSFSATGSFELDIKRLGLSAPKFLMFKVSDEVTVEISLRGEV